jgi:hypothetical protein
MYDYHPWVSGLLAEAGHKAELRHLAKAQLARQAMTARATSPSKRSAHRVGRYFRHTFSGFASRWRLLFRRRVTTAP